MTTEAPIREFIHPQLNQTVTAIGGHYVLTEEMRLPLGDQELLCLTGYAVFDTTCCGAGGCSYALVPGVIRDWKFRSTPEGHAVSKVSPIRDQAVQSRARAIIGERMTVHQVNFE